MFRIPQIVRIHTNDGETFDSPIVVAPADDPGVLEFAARTFSDPVVSNLIGFDVSRVVRVEIVWSPDFRRIDRIPPDRRFLGTVFNSGV